MQVVDLVLCINSRLMLVDYICLCLSAVQWGTPFVIYWEYYDNGSTVPIVPKSGAITPLHQLFTIYYTAAVQFVASQGGSTTTAEVNIWAEKYFATPTSPQCTFEEKVKYTNGQGYNTSGRTNEDCCMVCAADPACLGICFLSDDSFDRPSR